MVVTSVAAYDFARKLCDEYERRKLKEKELNLEKEPVKRTSPDANGVAGPSRTVTQIDYAKHEKTAKELARQEKAEEYARKKAEASQWCTLDHEHGPHCRRPQSGCSHDHQKEWQIYEKTTEEKIQAADLFRQEGNEAYGKRNYGLAAVHYRKALLQFDYTFPETEELEKLADATKLRCLLNLAACKCQQEEWDEVLTQCRLALEIDPRSVKAHYRTGLAHLARDHFDLAKAALTSAYNIEPRNPEVLAALKQLKHNMETYKVRRKEVFREMANVCGAQEETAPDLAEAPPEEVPVADEEVLPEAEDEEEAGDEDPEDAGLLEEAASSSGLRRRFGGAEEAERFEAALRALQHKGEKRCSPNRLLVVATFLGLVSVAATGLAVALSEGA